MQPVFEGGSYSRCSCYLNEYCSSEISVFQLINQVTLPTFQPWLPHILNETVIDAESYLSDKLMVLHFALRLSLCSLLCEVLADTAWLNTAWRCCSHKKKQKKQKNKKKKVSGVSILLLEWEDPHRTSLPVSSIIFILPEQGRRWKNIHHGNRHYTHYYRNLMCITSLHQSKSVL